MALTQVRGLYHNMPVIFHQEAGQTVKITPGHFCPRCHETRYHDLDEGFLQCSKCGRAYFVPSQEQIDRAAHGSPEELYGFNARERSDP